MRRILIPAAAAVLVIAAMVYQAKTIVPVLCEPPHVVLPELAGYTSEVVEPSEAELQVLPADTQFVKRNYTADNGATFLVSAVIGGQSKSSIHRPELCLPGQGFQMRAPRVETVDGIEWHFLKLDRQSATSLCFAYTFFNQDGFRTSSHMKRILRDVWDRSVLGRIDRWVMVTVNASITDDRILSEFLSKLQKGGALCVTH